MTVNEKYRELLEQYDVRIISTFRSRGTFQCETDQGLALLKEYHHSLRRLALEYEWKEKLAEAGFSLTDRYFLSREDSLVVYDRYHTPFVLKHYFSGRECDLTSRGDVRAACANLAQLHSVSATIPDPPFAQTGGSPCAGSEPDLPGRNPSFICKNIESPAQMFARRNQELKTIRRFISRVNHKKSFELLYMKYFPYYYAEAERALAALRERFPEGPGTASGVCHGAYHQHNILMLPDGSVATIGFESVCYQPFLMDLYLFLRKTMEKSHYDFRLFENGVAGYGEHLPVSGEDLCFLYYLFLYPEKFWKISNQYYNRRKSWQPPKMCEKLERIAAQNEERLHFLEQFSRYLLK